MTTKMYNLITQKLNT